VTTTTQRLNRAALARAVKEEQQRLRAKLVEIIRTEIDDIRKRREELLVKVRRQCKVGRENVRERVRRRREEAKAELSRELAQMRQAESNRCQLRKARVRLQSESAIDRRRREARERTRAEAHARKLERHTTRKERERSKVEKQKESDDEVRANLEPEFVPLFDVVRAKIRARPGMSRTEAFLHWLEENPDESWRMRDDLAERRLRALLKEQHEAERALRRAGGRVESARARRKRLEPAPF